MKTDQNSGKIFCNNCNTDVEENETKLVLAQGLMMPNWLGGWKIGDEKHRHGFSILLRICCSCYDCLNSTSDVRAFKKVLPFSETHHLDNFYSFYAGKTKEGVYFVRRKYYSDSYYHAPRGYFYGSPEPITIIEENKYVYD